MTERQRPKAQKALRTSDVTRPRMLLLAALGAGVCAAAAALGSGLPLGGKRPLPRTHAKVACASCHGATVTATATEPSHARLAVPNAACTHCHGTSHGSTRPAHRALVASGELGCATCHTQHAGAQGVTFEATNVVLWRSGGEQVIPPPVRSGVAPGSIPRGTTVPRVSLAVCARCHDPASVSDPITACVSRSASTSQCFDEHSAGSSERAPSAERPVCAAQHTTTRYVAWEAARDLAATVPPVTVARRDGAPWVPAAAGLVGALVLGAAHAAMERRRRRRETAATAPARVAPPERKRLPTINQSTCLGC
jgi:hypothetical protein